MRFAGLIAFLLLAGCVTPIQGSRWHYHNDSPPDGKVHPVTVSPGVLLPADEWLAGRYPRRARWEGPVSGRARIWCTVGAQGSLDACQVMDEFPHGHGFGEATLRILHFTRADLGTAPAGSQVEIGLAFTASVEVRLECDLSAERLATHCRAYHQVPHGASEIGARVALNAEGKPPPPEVTGRLPGRMRWDVVVDVPVEDGP